jgi:predicted phosphate transport protein (TIGR00153 family)
MIFFKKRPDFFNLLLTHSQKMQEGLKALADFMEEPSRDKGLVVDKVEREADELRRQLIEELNRSFVTPIDREDIFQLSGSVDDMVDYAKATVMEMIDFEVPTNNHLKTMTQGVCEIAEAVTQAISQMRDNPHLASELAVKAKKRENFVEHCYREALVDLFHSDDVKMILKTREIYRHLSNAADRGDAAANIIGNIIIKVS